MLLDAERSFRRVKGYRYMPVLIASLEGKEIDAESRVA